MRYFLSIFVPLTVMVVTPQPSSAAITNAVGSCTQFLPVVSGAVSSPNLRFKVRGTLPRVRPVVAPSSTAPSKVPTTFPAPLTKAEMDAAEAKGKAMQKQMMDRKEAEDAKNTAPPIAVKVAQALTKEGCVPVPMTDSGPGPTTSVPATSIK